MSNESQTYCVCLRDGMYTTRLCVRTGGSVSVLNVVCLCLGDGASPGGGA